MIRKPRTLLWQLGLALMALQAGAVLLLAWYAAVQFRAYTSAQTIVQLQRLQPIVEQRFGALLDEAAGDQSVASRSDLQRAVRETGRLAGIRITIIAPDGEVWADSEADPAAMENHRYRPEIDAALQQGEGESDRLSATTEQRTVYLARVIRRDGAPVAVVRTALPVAGVKAGPARVVRLVATAAGVSLLLTFLLIYFVSRYWSRKIVRITSGAERFAAGELAHRIDEPNSSELAALAAALNRMAQRLNEQLELLRTQRSEQQAIHQSMSNGLIAMDLDQRIISVNRAAERLLGINGDAARGRLLQEVVREPGLNRFVADAMAGVLEGAERSGASGGPRELNLRGRNELTVEARAEPLRNPRDVPVGVMIFINDVTQLRRLESIRSDFAANVSHELRTPITNIKGYVETMLDVGVDDREQAQRFLQIISRNTARLASIIEDLLALARLEQPDTPSTLELEQVPARRVIEAAAAQLRGDAEMKSMTLRIDAPPELVVAANPQLLEQALANLISNAIKYSPESTQVTITASTTERGETRISVADEGPGIAPEHLSRIFERFYRVDKARSRALGGTGLGLAIVKHIARVHGGRVSVESTVGRGSIFTIVLPSRRAPTG